MERGHVCYVATRTNIGGRPYAAEAMAGLGTQGESLEPCLAGLQSFCGPSVWRWLGHHVWVCTALDAKAEGGCSLILQSGCWLILVVSWLAHGAAMSCLSMSLAKHPLHQELRARWHIDCQEQSRQSRKPAFSALGRATTGARIIETRP